MSCEDACITTAGRSRCPRYVCMIEVTYRTRTGVHVRRQRLTHYLYRYVFKDCRCYSTRVHLTYLHLMAHKQVNYQYYIFNHPNKVKYVNPYVAENFGLDKTYSKITALTIQYCSHNMKILGKPIANIEYTESNS